MSFQYSLNRLVLSPLAFVGVDLHESAKRVVIGLLNLRWKDAGGQFVVLEMVGNTLTALAFPRAGLVGAVAFGLVGLNIAFHLKVLLSLD
jgi:hypothetical protein